MADLLREQASLTPQQRQERRDRVTAFSQKYGKKEFIEAILNVYERAITTYAAKNKQKH